MMKDKKEMHHRHHAERKAQNSQHEREMKDMQEKHEQEMSNETPPVTEGSQGMPPGAAGPTGGAPAGDM